MSVKMLIIVGFVAAKTEPGHAENLRGVAKISEAGRATVSEGLYFSMYLLIHVQYSFPGVESRFFRNIECF